MTVHTLGTLGRRHLEAKVTWPVKVKCLLLQTQHHMPGEEALPAHLNFSSADVAEWLRVDL